MKLNKELKRLRIENSITAQALSEKSGVNRSTIFNYENGKMDITTNTLCKLVTALGASIEIPLQDK